MPNWCEKHAQHTIDDVCPGCDRDSKRVDIQKIVRDHSPFQLREIAAKLLNAAERKRLRQP